MASCNEKAYEKLRISDAQRMMMFDSEAAVRQYAAEVGGGVGNEGHGVSLKTLCQHATELSEMEPVAELAGHARAELCCGSGAQRLDTIRLLAEGSTNADHA